MEWKHAYIVLIYKKEVEHVWPIIQAIFISLTAARLLNMLLILFLYILLNKYYILYDNQHGQHDNQHLSS